VSRVTTATRITVARFFFVPPLAVAIAGAAWWPGHAVVMRVAAVALLAGAAFTDFLDGYVARRLDQRSRVGAALDPLADKLLLGAAIWVVWACRGAYARVPLWYPVLVTANDVVLGAGFLAVRHRIDADKLRAMLWGKVATTAQIIFIVWVLTGIPETRVGVVIAGVLTAASGTAYVVRALRLMNKTALRTQDSEA
jgi:cardiolipin synthase